MNNRFRNEPAASLYDALVAEMAKRPEADELEWIDNERNAIHRKAVELAKKLGLHAPTLEEIKQAETQACGHIDYTPKFVLHVQDLMYRR